MQNHDGRHILGDWLHSSSGDVCPFPTIGFPSFDETLPRIRARPGRFFQSRASDPLTARANGRKFPQEDYIALWAPVLSFSAYAN
jgi:hypothetical protein